MKKVDIVRINRGKREDVKDTVTLEVPLTLKLNGKEIVTILCSPNDLKSLSVGFFYSAGLIKSIQEVRNITIDNYNWVSFVELKTKPLDTQVLFKRVYTSGCGKGTLFYNIQDLIHRKKITSKVKVVSEKIIKLMNNFQHNSITFKQTGGVHSAALSDANDILVFKEDIGRHNALDKAIGEAIIKNIKIQDLLILTSGRITAEIVLKAVKTRSPFLISRSAPTDQAVKLAQHLNLTLIGFVRGKRMNIYTGAHRVV